MIIKIVLYNKNLCCICFPPLTLCSREAVISLEGVERHLQCYNSKVILAIILPLLSSVPVFSDCLKLQVFRHQQPSAAVVQP